MAMLAPSCAKRMAIPSPIPDEAPVIKTFLPESLGILLLVPDYSIQFRLMTVYSASSVTGRLFCRVQSLRIAAYKRNSGKNQQRACPTVWAEGLLQECDRKNRR